jgi:molybdopterin-containing oxidoreductase family membrane subunit
MAIFSGIDTVVNGIHAMKKRRWKTFRVYSPVPHHDIEHAIESPKSPVRIFTLVGALLGFCTGWALTIYSVHSYPLIVGGKPLMSLPPFGVLAYILTILFGALATMIGFLIHARLPQLKLATVYDERLSSDHFGIQFFGDDTSRKDFEAAMKKAGAVRFRRDQKG